MEAQDRLPGLVLDLQSKLYALGEDDFLLGREQRHARDLPQVQPHRVLGIGFDLFGDLRLVRVGISDWWDFLGGTRKHVGRLVEWPLGRLGDLGRLGRLVGKHGLEVAGRRLLDRIGRWVNYLDQVHSV